MLYTGQWWRMSLYHFQEHFKCYDSKIGMCQVKKNIFLTWNTCECTSNFRQKGQPFCIYKYELLIQMSFFWESHHLTFYNQNLSLITIWLLKRLIDIDIHFWRSFPWYNSSFYVDFIFLYVSACWVHNRIFFSFFNKKKLWSSIFSLRNNNNTRLCQTT